MSRSHDELAARLAVPPSAGRFSPADVADVPAGARSMLTAAIEPGTPLAAAVRLRMRGAIRLGRWLPFRGSEILAPGRGFLWRATVARVVRGHDRLVDGDASMHWRLAGLLTVAEGHGPDVTRSAAGREAGEAFWLPTALLPSAGTQWLASDDDRQAVARVGTATGEPVDVTYELDAAGHVQSLSLLRWGDPESTGTFGMHSFGGTVTGTATFRGLTVPTRGSVGWHFGEPGWSTGEFFRFEVTDVEPVA